MTHPAAPERTEGHLADLYFRLQEACRQAVRRGAPQRALVLSRRATVAARATRRPDLLHRAATSRSMVLLELGQVRDAEKGLREVVLESADNEVICRAAFYLASSLRRQRRMSRALFFARKAADKAEELEDPVWQARCHNLLGNIQMNQGQLDEALVNYQEALCIWRGLPGDHRFATAIVLDNIGYCQTLEKRLDDGITTISEALELALEIGDRRTEAECRQDLAHAHLLAGRPEEARGHAEAALTLAEAAGFRDILQNSIYILGEVAALEGDDAARDAYFARLQSFFPEFPYLRDFLRMFDLSDILTFH